MLRRREEKNKPGQTHS